MRTRLGLCCSRRCRRLTWLSARACCTKTPAIVTNRGWRWRSMEPRRRKHRRSMWWFLMLKGRHFAPALFVLSELGLSSDTSQIIFGQRSSQDEGAARYGEGHEGAGPLVAVAWMDGDAGGVKN